jgi:nickel/cobalt transporter (NicO) family protein
MTVQHRRIAAAPSFRYISAVAALMLMRPSFAWAAPGSPFGAGLPDGNVPGATWFPRLAGTLISIQFYFNQHITAAVRAMRHDSSAFWTLIALSFFYGIVHAAGPGHGKAVVSSYVLANRQTLRNGVLLAFVASLAQALGAIVLILVASMLLHLTSVSITNATYQFEILSDILVVVLGIWLVWSKILRPTRSLKLDFTPVTALTQPQRLLNRHAQMGAMTFQAVDATMPTMRATSAGAAVMDAHRIPHGHDDRHEHEHEHDHDHDHDHHHGCACGHAHMPDARAAAGSLDWRKAWTVVASTGLRPCTGALIVLVFSISQKLLLAGIAATLVMGLGTAITVATLAVLAVSARQTASVLTSADSPFGRRIIRSVEACGSVAVLLFGVLLLAGNLFL